MRGPTGYRTAASILLACASFASADEVRGAHMSVQGRGHGEFHVALCEHYRVERDVVIVVQSRRIPDDDLPVVFFLAERCRVAPHVIVDLRLAGRSWMDIAHRHGLGADVFHVEVFRVHGPPYGKAFGHFRKPRAEWVALRLPDDDVVTLVHTKFLSAHYGLSPDDVMDMRRKDEGFVGLHDRVKVASPRARSKDAPAKNPATDVRGKDRVPEDKKSPPPGERGGRIGSAREQKAPRGSGGRGKGR